jgi:hypothetical protein
MTLGSHDTLRRLTLAAIGLLFGLAGSFALTHHRPGPQAVAAHPTIAARASAHPRPRRASSLPLPAVAALARGDLVVLSFVMPGSEVDATASAEARAAARSSGASYFAVDASSTAAAVLLRRYGLKSTPALVVLAPPNHVRFRASMFLDAAAVRQALADARG